MTNVNSIKDRLRNIAKNEHSTMQNELITYALERAIYRMSVSDYASNFTLKGGIFLYAFFDRKYPRATMDIDLLADRISNDSEHIKSVFKDIFSISCDDALNFDLSTLEVNNIPEFKDYHGVNVRIIAFLDRTRIPVSIDVGFGDIIYPDRIQMEFPVLLDMDVPYVNAYSIYSVIAAKFEAIVSLGKFNSRYKDFYDIFAISNEFALNGKELQAAVIETFNHRNTDFSNIVAFDEVFINDSSVTSRWKSFVKKKQVNQKINFSTVINQNKLLLLPIVDSIQKNESFDKHWDSAMKMWI